MAVAQLNDVFPARKPVTFGPDAIDENISVTTHDEETSHCLNCGAAVSYHYCALCGQETKLHVASAAEFIHEFVGHYIALEGKLWVTVLKLLTRPGFLTAEYIAGRRARYVQPLRVYLSFSILFFLLVKLAGTPVGSIEQDGARAKAQLVSVHQAKAAQAPSPWVSGLPLALQGKLNAFNARPVAEQSRLLGAAFFAYVPYAMFLLMPVFAFYLKLLYAGSGRRYGEHLLFALHTNAFAFAMFSLFFLTSFLELGLLTFAMIMWLMFYLPTAMRRVYGGSRLTTALRWLVLAGLHLVSIGAGIAAAYGIAVLA
jgi:hypothetical protein